jgi:hypothetical protein
MKHTLKLEHIGADVDDRCRLYNGIIREIMGSEIAKQFNIQSRRPWVAQIISLDTKFGFTRRFLKPFIDYVDSNRCGSRGVMHVYLVEDGRIYEIKEHSSWRTSRRYFARWANGQKLEMIKEEVIQHLREENDASPNQS